MKKFEVGQKVYSLSHGWGEVMEIKPEINEYRIMVNFGKSGVYSFTEDGRCYQNAPVSLFHYEPEIVEKKWQPKKGEWCWFWNKNNNKESACIMRFSWMNGDKFITTLGVGWTNCTPFPIEHLPEHLKETK